MKLYRAGFGAYMYYVGANEPHEAIAKVMDKYNMQALPCIAEEVTVEGCVVSVNPEAEPCEEAEPEAEETKHLCKRCQEAFENKGSLLAHAKKCGKE